MAIFKGNALANSDLFKSLQQVDDNLLSGASDYTSRRISIKGGKFREIVNGDQVNVSKEDNMEIVIVNAATLSRTYYEGSYDPSNVAPPACWSHDTKVPAPEVENPKASNCQQCPMNVKGSGQGETRACKFQQRLAITPANDLKNVFQLSLPATSIFGDSKDGNMPMQAYAKFLKAHSTPAIAIVTDMYFDEKSDVPKLFFKPARPLEENELQQVIELKDTEEATRAITFTVSQTDKVDKKQPVKASAPVEEATQEEVPEPTKNVATKKAKKEVTNVDLSNIIDEWDD